MTPGRQAANIHFPQELECPEILPLRLFLDKMALSALQYLGMRSSLLRIAMQFGKSQALWSEDAGSPFSFQVTSVNLPTESRATGFYVLHSVMFRK